MSVSAEALDIILRLQGVPTYTAAMREASAANKEFAASTRDMAAANDEVAVNARKAEAGAALVGRASKVVGIGVLAAVADGFKQAVEFNRQMELIHTQVGASQAEVRSMAGFIQNFKGSIFNPKEMAEAAFHLESVGLRGTQAMKALELSVQGAAVGNAHLEEVANALGAAWVANVKGVHGFNQIMGVLNATVGQGNMRMEDLVRSLGTGVLPVANIAHLSLQEVGAAIATLVDSGFKASSATAQFGTALHYLYSPTARAKDAMQSLGFTAEELYNVISSRGLGAGLQLLRNHLDALSEPEKARVLGEILPGGRGKVFIALIDELTRYEQKLQKIRQTQNDFKQSLKATEEQPLVKIKQAWVELEKEILRIGQAVEGPGTTVIVAFAGVLLFAAEALMLVTDHGKLLVPILATLGGLWLAYKTAVITAAIAQWIWDGALTAGIVALYAWDAAATVAAGAMWLLNAAMDANPVGIIILGVGLLIVGVVELIKHWHDVAKFLRGPMGTAVLVLISLFQPYIGIPLAIAAHWKTLLGVIKDVGKWIASEWGKYGHILAYPFEKMYAAAKWAYEHIKALFTGGHHGTGGIGHAGASFGSKVSQNFLEGIPLVGPVLGMLPHLAHGGTMPYSGYAVMNENQQGETVWLPGGSTVQPSAASSMMVPRAHTPTPTPLPEPQPIKVDAYLQLGHGGASAVYKLITKSAAVSVSKS